MLCIQRSCSMALLAVHPQPPQSSADCPAKPTLQVTLHKVLAVVDVRRGGEGIAAGAVAAAAEVGIVTWSSSTYNQYTEEENAGRQQLQQAGRPGCRLAGRRERRTDDGSLVPREPPAILVPHAVLVLVLGAAVVEHLQGSDGVCVRVRHAGWHG